MRLTSSILALSLMSLTKLGFANEADTVRVIVKYKNPKAALAVVKKPIRQAATLPITEAQPMAGGAYVLTLDAKPLKKLGIVQAQNATTWAIKRLQQDPNVLYAVEDRKGYFKPLPPLSEDPIAPRLSHEIQWDEFARPGGIMLESAPGKYDGAWSYTTGDSSPSVVVAVLDTGVEDHPSLTDNLLKTSKGKIFGWNFAGNNDDLSDETESYHGTHVSGTIAGYGDTIKGMGEHLKILTVKIPDESGMFYESAVVNAMRWAVGDHIPGVPDNPYPANVLNMSFGVDERPGKEVDHCDEALQEAIFYVRKQGAVLVAAAGNDNRWEHFNAPAVCNGTIKVAATGPEGLRAYYSNFGPSVTLAAPGGDLSSRHQEDGILSTVKPGAGYKGSGFDFYQGTSMASPHVAGVAGLIYAVSNDHISPQRVEQILYATTHEFGESKDPKRSCVGEVPCGHGILDAEYAVKAAYMHYDELLSAPSLKKMDSLTTPSPWILLSNIKTLGPASSFPYVKQDKDGKIYAFSGYQTFQLDENAYQYCEVIGYDGVGCYR
ncbi:S8 family serine peptidase [Legionella impletisoli]|uniref:Serine metalloprotease n=1 Tax=Legionella impletisoli TaxID=343510 RepID=A0A917JS60_9GAMM|nr:S8 family serine peptidase [Legionella impletisoli]GGI83753.1 serine metalloprotease [Legionella impletisoli]